MFLFVLAGLFGLMLCPQKPLAQEAELNLQVIEVPAFPDTALATAGRPKGPAARPKPQKVVKPNKAAPGKKAAPAGKGGKGKKINRNGSKPKGKAPGKKKVKDKAQGKLKKQPPKLYNAQQKMKTMVSSPKRWTNGEVKNAKKNLNIHYLKHRKDFSTISSQRQYREAALRFTKTPPKGTQMYIRKNGDRVYYQKKTNTFAITNSRGTPRTLFKPTEKEAYFKKERLKDSYGR
ncbi:MAG: hypothetical protein AB8B94_14210 [Hyphomicrobiales bacterium]